MVGCPRESQKVVDIRKVGEERMQGITCLTAMRELDNPQQL